MMTLSRTRRMLASIELGANLIDPRDDRLEIMAAQFNDYSRDVARPVIVGICHQLESLIDAENLAASAQIDHYVALINCIADPATLPERTRSVVEACKFYDRVARMWVRIFQINHFPWYVQRHAPLELPEDRFDASPGV